MLRGMTLLFGLSLCVFHHANADLFSIIATTESSVTLEWRFVGFFHFRGVALRYRLREPVVKPEALEWEPSLNHYKIYPTQTSLEWGLFQNLTVGERLYPVKKEASFASIVVNNSTFLRTGWETNRVLIKVYNLRFTDKDYVFELLHIPDADHNGNWTLRTDFQPSQEVIADVVGHTLPVVPQNPPKTGKGCFQVIDANASDRLVNIFWRKRLGAYRVTVFEGSRQKLIELSENLRGNTFTRYAVGLKRYSFVFQSSNSAGYSTHTSTVIVPARKSIVPVPSNFSFTMEKGEYNTYELKWRKPDRVKIRSYTLAWVTAFDGRRVDVLHDFVYLDDAAKSFRMSTDHANFQLAISVNTRHSSSGFYVAGRVSNTVPTVYEVHDT